MMDREPRTTKAMPLIRLLNLPPEVLLEICRHVAAPMQNAFWRHLHWHFFPGGAMQRTNLADVLTCGAPLARLMRTCRVMHSIAGYELYSCYCDMLCEALFPDFRLLLDVLVPERFIRHFRLPRKSLTEEEEEITVTLTGLDIANKSGMCVDIQNDGTPDMDWSDE
ncbi:hypothetical protein CFIO01_07974 [Colletotrichum fioriniae PJ7]|uniref:Uncharacterized protein n=1 Tax=Colletotrichum fioriniae PJ7 TaxID=1445577 RepID=A0A010RE98_9PEZI|nr:hypothetical protein CFIO01_07974 [Colletotrichum fioriniae PJ7]